MQSTNHALDKIEIKHGVRSFVGIPSRSDREMEKGIHQEFLLRSDGEETRMMRKSNDERVTLQMLLYLND